MKKILLHVGTHKTGSSTIQNTLFENRGILASHDIHYLGLGANHWQIYSAFMDAPWDWFEHRRMGNSRVAVEQLNETTLREVGEEISDSHCTNIIISSEYLAQLGKSRVQELRDYLLALGTVEVVYFCREIVSWISSDSQQCAKVGMKAQPTKYNVAIKRLYDFPLNYLAVFGRENFNMVRFEDALARGLCNALLDCGGLPTIQSMGIEERLVNQSISAEAASAFYTYNRIHPLGQPTRNGRMVKTLREMPGRPYRINLLSKAEASDCNRKMRYMRRRYGFPMYPDVKPGQDNGQHRTFGEESIAYLVDRLNSAFLRLRKNSKRLKTIEDITDAALEQAREAHSRGEFAQAAKIYDDALQQIAATAPVKRDNRE